MALAGHVFTPPALTVDSHSTAEGQTWISIRSSLVHLRDPARSPSFAKREPWVKVLKPKVGHALRHALGASSDQSWSIEV
jgi:hypothetical protein